MKIYFDMDGTIADLYNFKGWLGYLEASQTKPYRHCEPIGDYKRAAGIMRYMVRRGDKFSIISWGSRANSDEFLRRTARAKRDWLKKYYSGIFFNNTFTHYGIPKNSVVDARGAYLFDDNADVGRDWEAAGGIWIDVTKCDFVEKLFELAIA